MILLDVDLGSERAVDFVLEVRKRGFKGKILVLTAGASPEEAVHLVRAVSVLVSCTNITLRRIVEDNSACSGRAGMSRK
jgi:hypothetical protein